MRIVRWLMVLVGKLLGAELSSQGIVSITGLQSYFEDEVGMNCCQGEKCMKIWMTLAVWTLKQARFFWLAKKTSTREILSGTCFCCLTVRTIENLFNKGVKNIMFWL